MGSGVAATGGGVAATGNGVAATGSGVVATGSGVAAMGNGVAATGNGEKLDLWSEKCSKLQNDSFRIFILSHPPKVRSAKKLIVTWQPLAGIIS